MSVNTDPGESEGEREVNSIPRNQDFEQNKTNVMMVNGKRLGNPPWRRGSAFASGRKGGLIIINNHSVYYEFC